MLVMNKKKEKISLNGSNKTVNEDQVQMPNYSKEKGKLNNKSEEK